MTNIAYNQTAVGTTSDTMAELAGLLKVEIPEGKSNLTDSHINLERVAEYCENNYFQSENKRIALEETKNYTTQSLASVAYQINTLAYNFLQLLDLQTAQLGEMESQMNHIAQTVMIHKEKVARREIGVLTANKTTNRQYKITAPADPEKPVKYVRRSIDFNALDDIGHGIRSLTTGNTPRSKQRGSSQGSIQSLGAGGSAATLVGQMGGAAVGPAPTTKPPTPPQAVRAIGSLSKASREYRTPPAVAPPQVPSHYAPNYPLGHPRRSGDRGPGYSTLPVHSHTLPHQHHGGHHAHHGHHTLSQHGYSRGDIQQHQQQLLQQQQAQQAQQQQQQQQQQLLQQQQQAAQQQAAQQHQQAAPSPLTLPQVGLVHPIPHTPPPSTPPSSYPTEHHMSMPRPTLKSALKNSAPPSPLVLSNNGGMTAQMPAGMVGHHTLPHHHTSHGMQQHYRTGNGNQTPPPPVQPNDEPDMRFGQPRAAMGIVPDQMDLPGWVPKNYIEKVVAIYDYFADKDDELSFQESSVIYVLKKNNDGWWEGVMDGITGLFPGNYVEPCV